jgi:hypothetical protein
MQPQLLGRLMLVFCPQMHSFLEPFLNRSSASLPSSLLMAKTAPWRNSLDPPENLDLFLWHRMGEGIDSSLLTCMQVVRCIPPHGHGTCMYIQLYIYGDVPGIKEYSLYLFLFPVG